MLRRSLAMHTNILIRVIEDNVRITLCNGHGTDLDLRGARGNDIRDTAILEADLDIGQVFMRRIDGLAQGIHAPHRRAHEVQDDVDIMDHDIEDDPILLDTRHKGPQATAFDQPADPGRSFLTPALPH